MMEKIAKIMVVEDEGIVSIDIRNMLKNAGYSIAAVAFRGKEAVEKAEQSSPDLVLMDIGLEGEIDGIEAARRIQDRFRIPVVFLTGYADEKTMASARKVNPLGFVIKPINEEQLRKTLDDIFDKK